MKPSPENPLPVRPVPTPTWIAIGAILLLGFLHFWVRTMPVRFATTDDLAFQAEADRGHGADYMTEAAHTQARFYYATPIFHRALLALYEVPSPWLFSLWRAAGFYLQIGLAAWLVARVLGHAVHGAAVALLLTGVLHLPPTFYLVLSYPFNWIGGSALLAALLCHHAYLQQRRLWPGIMAAGLYLLACLMHELFVLFLPTFVALSLHSSRGGWRGLIRANLGPAVVAGSYLLVYFAFAREYPTSYEGTRLSADFTAAGKILVRQMAGITPGFELLVNRPPAGTPGPLLRPLAEIGLTLRQLPMTDLWLGLGQALVLTWVLARCLRHASPGARHWPWLLAWAVVLNLPVAFSEKYQTFIFHREYPYAYGFYSYLCAGMAGVGAVAWLGGRPTTPGERRVWVGAFAAAAVIFCVSAQASNHRILHLLLQRFN